MMINFKFNLTLLSPRAPACAFHCTTFTLVSRATIVTVLFTLPQRHKQKKSCNRAKREEQDEWTRPKEWKLVTTARAQKSSFFHLFALHELFCCILHLINAEIFSCAKSLSCWWKRFSQPEHCSNDRVSGVQVASKRDRSRHILSRQFTLARL